MVAKPSLFNSGLFVFLVALSFAAPAQAYDVTCRARKPVIVGRMEPIVYDAIVSGGAGSLEYYWEYEVQRDVWAPVNGDGVGLPTASVLFTTIGHHVARVTVTDLGTGELKTQGCGMFVLPDKTVDSRYSNQAFDFESVMSPVLWVPSGVQFNENELSELRRSLRMIRAGYFHLYGKTFRMRDLRVYQSSRTENDICGMDCSEKTKLPGQPSGIDILVGTARGEVDTYLNGISGQALPYATARAVITWGAGAWSGSNGWDIARPVVGDVTIAAIMGIDVPYLESNMAEFVARGLGDYWGAVGGTLGHEMNHAIAWDDPHDFNLFLVRPGDYERGIALQGPWLTETLDDVTPPVVEILGSSTVPLSGTTTLQATASDDAMDAVLFFIDNKLIGTDTTYPYAATVDTTKFGFGKHTYSALAVDQTGNFTRADASRIFKNVLSTSSCSNTFPTGEFEACFYAGIQGNSGQFLGSMRDYPAPQETPDAGYLMRHFWNGADEIAFGQYSQISGIWRGRINFPAENYLIRVNADDGVKVSINNNVIVDALTDGAKYHKIPLALAGPTNVQVEWYQKQTDAKLEIFWQRFNLTPPYYQSSSITVLTPTVPPSTVLDVPVGEDLTIVANAFVEYDAKPYTFRIVEPTLGDLRNYGDTERQPLKLSSRYIENGIDQWTAIWRPTKADSGREYFLKLLVEDSIGLSTEKVIPIRIIPSQRPIFDPPLGETKLREGTVASILLRAEDSTGQRLTFTPTGLPDGAVGRLVGDMDGNNQVNWPDVLAVSDLGRQYSYVDSAEIAVADANRDGRIDEADVMLVEEYQREPSRYILAWKPSYNSARANPYSVTVTARDPDGNTSAEQVSLTVQNSLQWEPIGSKLVRVNEALSMQMYAQDDMSSTMQYGTIMLGSDNGVYPEGDRMGPLGDVNFDRTVNPADYLIISNAVAGSVNLSAIQKAFADSNGDGFLDDDDKTFFNKLIYQGIGPKRWVYAWVPDLNERGNYSYSAIGFGNDHRNSISEAVAVRVIHPSMVQPLIGRVVDQNGAPLGGVEVKASLRPTGSHGSLRPKTLTNAQGVYRFDGLPPGTVTVQPRAIGYNMLPLRSRFNWPSNKPPTFIAKKRTGLFSKPPVGRNGASGIILDTSGNRVAGVKIKLYGPMLHNGKTLSLYAYSESTGQFVFSNLPNGTYRLSPRLVRYAFDRNQAGLQQFTLRDGMLIDKTIVGLRR